MAVADLPNLEKLRFTPTQQKIMDLLSDGKPHAKDEIRECLWDTMTELRNVHVHITNLRTILRPWGYIITIKFKTRIPQYILSQSIEDLTQ